MRPTPTRALVACLLLSAPGLAQDAAPAWPQWRGPQRTGLGAPTGQGQPQVRWRAQVGRGYSSPSVLAGRVVVQGYIEGPSEPGQGTDRITCLELATGRVLWTHEYPAQAFANEHKGGALSTATLADGEAWVATRDGWLRALDLETGQPRLELDLAARHDLEPQRYGFASSPLLLEGRLYLNLGRPLALDPADGSTLWLGEDLAARYATLAPMTLAGTPALVAFGGEGVVVLERATGAELARHPFRKGNRNVEGATPIVLGTRIFASSAYDHGGQLIEFAGEAPELVWASRNLRTKMAGAVLYEGHLYGFDESMLTCLELATGKRRWRLRGLGQGALCIAGGELLTTTSQGELWIGPASPEGFEPTSRTPCAEEGVFWTAPVPVGRRILVRGSAGDLVCLERDAAAGLAQAEDATGPAAEAAPLPEAAALFARHRAALGLEPEEDLPYLRLEGRLHMNALGLVDVKAAWELLPGGQWHAEYGLPPAIGGSFHRYFDGEFAWESNPYRGDKSLSPEQLLELQSTAGQRDLLLGPEDYAELRVVGPEPFAERPCLRLDAKLADGRWRQLYFDAGSGLLAGRSGENEAIVEFSDWRPVEREGGRALRLPFARRAFDTDTGLEERWTFQQAALGPVPEEPLACPEELRRPAEAPPESPPGDGDD